MALKTCELEIDKICLGTENLRSWAGQIVCEACYASEMALQSSNNQPIKQQERVDSMNNAVNAAKYIDAQIKVRTDLFNAATVAIVDIKKGIDADTSITNKPYALATALTERFTHFKSLAFELNEKLVEAGNQQKAIQVYLNQLANQLRVEEREKLQIQDMNYKPNPVKTIKPAAIKTAKGKLDKVALRELSKELGIAEFTIQMLVVSQGKTVAEVGNMLRKSIKESLSEKSDKVE